MLNIAFAHDTSAIGFAVFSTCCLMVLVLGEQNCKSLGAFEPNFKIEGAAFRDGSSCANSGGSNLI